MQKCVARAVSGGTSASRLPTFAVVLALPAKGSLINPALFGSRKRQAHVFQFEYRLGPHGTHVFDRVLISNVIRALDRVVHVPPPIILRISTRNGTGDSALR